MSDLRIVLADDHALFRAGLRSLVAAMDGFTVVGEAGDGLEVLRLLNSEDVDIVLLDLMMPGLNGLEAATRIARDFPNVTVVILSMHASEEFIAPSLRAGARGYLVKDMQPEELATALRTVAQGSVYVSDAIRVQQVEHGRHPAVISDECADLTSRQREVLQLVALGYSTKAISARLGLANKTVETHRSQLMGVLGIRDIAGLTRYAIRQGLVSPNS